MKPSKCTEGDEKQHNSGQEEIQLKAGKEIGGRQKKFHGARKLYRSKISISVCVK